jgi:hypothetical protein
MTTDAKYRVTCTHDALRTLPCEIESFTHCKRCVDEMPAGHSPASWARLSVGVTKTGAIQVWCERHGLNVVRFGFACEPVS